MVSFGSWSSFFHSTSVPKWRLSFPLSPFISSPSGSPSLSFFSPHFFLFLASGFWVLAPPPCSVDMISANRSRVPRDRSQLLLYFSHSTDSVDCAALLMFSPARPASGASGIFRRKSLSPLCKPSRGDRARGTDPLGGQEQLRSPRAAEFSLSASKPICVPRSPGVLPWLVCAGHRQLKPSWLLLIHLETRWEMQMFALRGKTSHLGLHMMTYYLWEEVTWVMLKLSSSLSFAELLLWAGHVQCARMNMTAPWFTSEFIPKFTDSL